jgi:3-hydroxybutyryl-CoA dehydrogenase
MLLEKIERGELGLKTGRGFYTYPNPRFLDPNWLSTK